MFSYTIQECDKNLLHEAKNFFGNIYIKKLKDESIASRYLIIKLIEKSTCLNVKFLETFKNGAPKPLKNLYWSVSHKTISNTIYLSAIISTKPIGIDIEYIRPRSKELLNIFSTEEYKIFGKKNWLNFYKIWTTKEALIKKLNLTFNDLKNIHFVNKTNVTYSNVNYKVNIREIDYLICAIV